MLVKGAMVELLNLPWLHGLPGNKKCDWQSHDIDLLIRLFHHSQSIEESPAYNAFCFLFIEEKIPSSAIKRKFMQGVYFLFFVYSILFYLYFSIEVEVFYPSLLV